MVTFKKLVVLALVLVSAVSTGCWEPDTKLQLQGAGTTLVEGKRAAVAQHIPYESFSETDALELVAAPAMSVADKALLREIVTAPAVHKQLYVIFIESVSDEVSGSAEDIAKMSREDFYKEFSKPAVLSEVLREFTDRVRPELYDAAFAGKNAKDLPAKVEQCPVKTPAVPGPVQGPAPEAKTPKGV